MKRLMPLVPTCDLAGLKIIINNNIILSMHIMGEQRYPNAVPNDPANNMHSTVLR